MATNEYKAKTALAAMELEAAVRRGALTMERVYLVAVATKGPGQPGRLQVIRESEAVPEGGAIVRPCEAGYGPDRWEAVPYSHMREAVYRACWRAPILSVD